MKVWKVVAISLLVLMVVGSAACSAGQNSALQTQVTITKGDLTVKVNGTGKAAYANDAKLAFGTAGKIEKLSIKKWDTVNKDTILAKLNTDSLELSLSQARTAEAQAQVALSQSQVALLQAQIGETQAQSAQSQAEYSLAAAQFNLDRSQAVSDIKDAITNAQWAIKVNQVNLSQAQAVGDSSAAAALNQNLLVGNIELAKQQKKLADLLAKDEYVTADDIAIYVLIGGDKYNRLSVEDVRMKQKQVEVAQNAVVQAKQNIEQTKQNTDLAKQSVEQAKRYLAQSQQNTGYIQKQITEATIVAPFSGIVAGLDVKEGDFMATPGLSTGTPIYMVDPNSLEISTEIDEIDVANVKLNQKAIINLDALPNTKFDGSVTAISVTPIVKTQNSGVVVYEVKVRFAGNPPAEAKAGMSANVDIITIEKKDILLIPNKSIKHNAQGQTVVNIVVNQKTEERQVKLGSTDGNQTEVISGLQPGDIIVKLNQTGNSKSSL